MEIGKAEKKIKLFFTLLACILNSSFFRLIHNFTLMFSSPSTRVFSSVTANSFFEFVCLTA